MKGVEQYLIKIAESSKRGTVTHHWFNAPSDLFDTTIVFSGNAKLYQDRLNYILRGDKSNYRVLIRIAQMTYQLRMIDLRVITHNMFDTLNSYFHDK